MSPPSYSITLLESETSRRPGGWGSWESGACSLNCRIWSQRSRHFTLLSKRTSSTPSVLPQPWLSGSSSGGVLSLSPLLPDTSSFLPVTWHSPRSSWSCLGPTPTYPTVSGPPTPGSPLTLVWEVTYVNGGERTMGNIRGGVENPRI